MVVDVEERHVELLATAGAVAVIDRGEYGEGRVDPGAGIAQAEQGDAGRVVKGTIGWPEYPDGSPSTCRFACKETDGEWVQPKWDTMWFPDAFAGVMEQFQYALASGTEPVLSGADNLKIMALVEAGYRSMKEKRMVAPSEITL
jgi:predicted dehydrogenase